MTRDDSPPAVMQRENERRRLTVPGKRTDDGNLCSLVAVCEISGAWALYPHGAAQLGVRLAQAEAQTLAAAIQTGSGLDSADDEVLVAESRKHR